MKKIILNDKTEINIRDGASISSMTTDIPDYSALETLAGHFTEENLKKVQFTWDAESGNITGEYVNMVLMEPNFQVTKSEIGLSVVFGLRELTEDEIKEPTVMTAISYLSDEQAATVKTLFPKWEIGKSYVAGDRRLYNNILYKCLQPHTSQAGWTPENSPSLWAKILIPDPGVIPEWEQPGSTNGYSIGDKVKHNGKTWESLVNNNVWEPGTLGTESIWKEE